MTDQILQSRDGGILTITMNMPEKRSPISDVGVVEREQVHDLKVGTLAQVDRRALGELGRVLRTLPASGGPGVQELLRLLPRAKVGRAAGEHQARDGVLASAAVELGLAHR